MSDTGNHPLHFRLSCSLTFVLNIRLRSLLPKDKLSPGYPSWCHPECPEMPLCFLPHTSRWGGDVVPATTGVRCSGSGEQMSSGHVAHEGMSPGGLHPGKPLALPCPTPPRRGVLEPESPFFALCSKILVAAACLMLVCAPYIGVGSSHMCAPLHMPHAVTRRGHTALMLPTSSNFLQGPMLFLPEGKSVPPAL